MLVWLKVPLHLQLHPYHLDIIRLCHGIAALIAFIERQVHVIHATFGILVCWILLRAVCFTIPCSAVSGVIDSIMAAGGWFVGYAS